MGLIHSCRCMPHGEGTAAKHGRFQKHNDVMIIILHSFARSDTLMSQLIHSFDSFIYLPSTHCPPRSRAPLRRCRDEDHQGGERRRPCLTSPLAFEESPHLVVVK